jgi:hypothetical protein
MDHAIELPSQAHRLHVAFHVLTPGIKTSAYRQHTGCAVHQGQLKPAFEMKGVIAASTSEFEARVLHLRVKDDTSPLHTAIVSAANDSVVVR